MTKLTCSRCRLRKPTSEFGVQKPSKKRPSEYRSQCNDCRKASRKGEYGKAKYPDPCTGCGKHHKLNESGQCSYCFPDVLRKCNECEEVLLAALSFYAGRAICIACYNAKRAKSSAGPKDC